MEKAVSYNQQWVVSSGQSVRGMSGGSRDFAGPLFRGSILAQLFQPASPDYPGGTSEVK